MFYIFAQAKVPQAAEIFSDQRDVIVSIRESIESIQLDLLNSTLYHWASIVGLFFFGIFLVFEALRAFKKVLRERNPLPLGGLFVRMILILGLVFNSGTGSNLGTLSYVSGGWLNQLSEAPITLVSKALGVDNAMAHAGGRSAVIAIRESGKKQCLELEKGNERDLCLVGVIDAVEEAVSPFIAIGGGETEEGKGWALKVLPETKDDFYKHFENPNTYSTGDLGKRAFKAVTDLASDIASATIMGWLFVIGSLFSFFTGVVQTAMIIVAPIIAGISTLPLFGDSFLNWTKNYFTLFLGKLVFNLLGAIAAFANLQPDSVDPIFFPLAMAILSSIFSFGLIRGAGPELVAAGARTTAGVAFFASSAGRLVRR